MKNDSLVSRGASSGCSWSVGYTDVTNMCFMVPCIYRALGASSMVSYGDGFTMDDGWVWSRSTCKDSSYGVAIYGDVGAANESCRRIESVAVTATYFMVPCIFDNMGFRCKFKISPN